MEIDLDELDAIVLDKELGVDIGHSPVLLTFEKFIDLLNSGMAKKFELNTPIQMLDEDCFHVANYRGVDFLAYGTNKIYDI